jgi:hypothetical protein
MSRVLAKVYVQHLPPHAWQQSLGNDLESQQLPKSLLLVLLLLLLRCPTVISHPTVNSPGYYYVTATGTAQPCPANSYSVGLRYQPSCTSCAGGFMTDPNAAPGTLFTTGEACSEWARA